MPIFELEANGKTFEVDAPDQSAALAAFKKMSGPAKPQGFMENAADFFKSIPRGLAQGFMSAPNPSMVPIEDELAATAPAREAAKETLLAPLPKPQGPAGQIAAAGAETVGNPMAWVGPGGPLLKLGGAALSGMGGEGARQAAEGTAFEKPAQIGGAVLGGVAAAKTLGPAAPKAAIPTGSELIGVADAGYKIARNSDLTLDPRLVSSWATRVEQELAGPKHGFTGGAQGVAPKTMATITGLQSAPEGAVVTASNLDALRQNLSNIAQETQLSTSGVAKPTPDAAAASIALRRLNSLTENLERLPPGAVLAGDAAAYVRTSKEANANYAAGQRVRDFDARLTKAENQSARQVSGSIDNAIRQKLGAVLDNPQKMRGLTDAERAQIKLINDGTFGSELLRQAGRGGAGVIPVMGQLAASGPVFAAGGLPGLALQGTVAAALYGARKGSESITKRRAQELVDMLAKRSPEFERRARELQQPSAAPSVAALARALLATQ